ncbi:MAG: hypothetical protein M3Z21_11745, partial [Pseudomonadota bacterium]|nr:hypothetical protein [Pseudomonadota bacterium]
SAPLEDISLSLLGNDLSKTLTKRVCHAGHGDTYRLKLCLGELCPCRGYCYNADTLTYNYCATTGAEGLHSVTTRTREDSFIISSERDSEVVRLEKRFTFDKGEEIVTQVTRFEFEFDINRPDEKTLYFVSPRMVISFEPVNLFGEQVERQEIFLDKDATVEFLEIADPQDLSQGFRLLIQANTVYQYKSETIAEGPETFLLELMPSLSKKSGTTLSLLSAGDFKQSASPSPER